MRVVAHKHKKETVISFIILAIASGFLVAFFVFDSVRLATYDAYNSVFKVVITDRVLKDEAQIYSNIAYCNTTNPRQTLDLYVPQVTSERPMKLVVFIHGGGWRAGDKSSQIMTYYSESFLKHGVAVASLNYRIYPEATYPKPNEDIACALKYLAKNVSKYDISSQKWAIFGDSAGAQLGAYAMSDSSVNKPLKLFIGFYGPYDLREQINRKPRRDNEAWNYTNKGKDAVSASPLLRNLKTDARYLVFHGQKDRIVPLSQSQNLQIKLQSQQISTSFILVKNADHYFSPRSDPSANQIKSTILTAINVL